MSTEAGGWRLEARAQGLPGQVPLCGERLPGQLPIAVQQSTTDSEEQNYTDVRLPVCGMGPLLGASLSEAAGEGYSSTFMQVRW